MDMLDKLKEYLDNATQEELQETYNQLSHLLCKDNSTIVERAVNVQHEVTPNRDWGDVTYGYERGATEQKAIDEKYIKLLEEDRNAFIAFCHNIINGMYISVIDAAKEQLGYLENKATEEE